MLSPVYTALSTKAMQILFAKNDQMGKHFIKIIHTKNT